MSQHKKYMTRHWLIIRTPCGCVLTEEHATLCNTEPQGLVFTGTYVGTNTIRLAGFGLFPGLDESQKKRKQQNISTFTPNNRNTTYVSIIIISELKVSLSVSLCLWKHTRRSK